jgi:cytochrome bd-type quinol oxidase subunit 2
MPNLQKIPWEKLALHLLCLFFGGFWIYIAPKFRAIFDSMGIDLLLVERLAFRPPDMYIYMAIAVCLFVLFLWCWKSGRLETKFGKIVNCITILLLIAGVVLFGLGIFGPGPQ